MDFPDDDGDELMLNAVQAYETTAADEWDGSVEFVGSQDQQKDGTNEPEEKYLMALNANFGHSSFRPLQWKIIRSILVDKRDNCAIMTTGYGKSLCYQFPSVYTNGVTLVISPLISLMEDQVFSLSLQKINACLLGTAQKDKKQIYEDIIQGMYRVVYLTPEFVTGALGMSILKKLEDILTLVAIDEAHCVSSWGHDFRSAFRGLSCIRATVPKVPIIALTATATKSVLNDIVSVLNLRNPLKLCSGFDRPNLKLIVRPKVSRWGDLQKILLSHKTGSVIIYCLKRSDTEDMVTVLQKYGLESAAYHAGLSLKIRKGVHEKFVKDQLRIIVATVAFGMGIDKPDVRCVINYGASREVESYYQEIGRAGRDGQPAQCITFYDQQDFQFHAHMRGLTKSQKHRNHLLALNQKFQCYLETSSCRRKFIMSYFCDPSADQLVTRANCCDNCDILLLKPQERVEYEGLTAEGLCDFRWDAKILLIAIDAVGPYNGLGVSILLVRGSNSQRVPKTLLQHPIRGTGAKKSDQWWKLLFDLLEKNHFVQTSTYRAPGQPAYMKRTRINVTAIGKTWLQVGAENPLFLRPKREMLVHFKVKRKEDDRILPLDSLRKDPVKQLQLGGNSEDNTVAGISVKTGKTFEEDLLKRLINYRMSLAGELDIMPYLVVSEKCLQQMVENPPTGREQLSNYDGMSLSKIDMFGVKFLHFIAKTMLEMEKDYPGRSRKPSIKPDDAGPSNCQTRSSPPPPTGKQNGNTSLLDDDDEDEAFLQAMLSTQNERTSPSKAPPAKKRLLEIHTTSAMLYDDSDSSDGDDIIAAIPISQERGVDPGWLSTRPLSQTSSQKGKASSQKTRTIKSVW